jgi:hypothetical protein
MNAKTLLTRQTVSRSLLFLALVLPLLVYSAVVFLSPSDVYSRYHLVRKFTDGVHGCMNGVASWIDIHKHAKSTDFAEVAMFSSSTSFFCIIWMIVGFQIFYLTANEKMRSIFLDLSVYSKKQIYGGATWIPIFGMFMPLGFFCLQGDPSFAAGLTTKNLFGYFFMSVLSIIFAGISVSYWPISIYTAFKLFFSKGN